MNKIEKLDRLLDVVKAKEELGLAKAKSLIGEVKNVDFPEIPVPDFFKKEEEAERNIGEALIKTYVSYAFTSLILSELLLMVWVKILGVNDYVAPILSLIITVPLNFVIQKFWAFKDKRNEKDKQIDGSMPAICFL